MLDKGIPVKEVIAARMYGTGKLYAFFDEKSIITCIPFKKESIGTGKYRNDGLKYDENEMYSCVRFL